MQQVKRFRGCGEGGAQGRTRNRPCGGRAKLAGAYAAEPGVPLACIFASVDREVLVVVRGNALEFIQRAHSAEHPSPGDGNLVSGGIADSDHVSQGFDVECCLAKFDLAHFFQFPVDCPLFNGLFSMFAGVLMHVVCQNIHSQIYVI